MKRRFGFPWLLRPINSVCLPILIIAAACPAVRAQTTGSVTVRVSEATTEAPVYQAEVKLLSFGHMSASYWAFTDGGGHAEFPAVERGAYRVEVKKADFDIGQEQVDVAPGLIYNVFVGLRASQPRSAGTSPPTGTVSVRDAAVPSAAQKEFDAGSEMFTTDPQGSIIHFRKAAELYPKFTQAWMSLALVYLKLERPDDALNAAGKAVEADPKLGTAYTLQGRLLMENRDFKKAETALKESLRLAPQAWEAHFELARCYYNTGKVSEALEQARQARNAPQSNPVTHQLLADIYLKLDQKKEALDELEAFAKAQPTSPMLPRIQQKIAALQAKP